MRFTRAAIAAALATTVLATPPTLKIVDPHPDAGNAALEAGITVPLTAAGIDLGNEKVAITSAVPDPADTIALWEAQRHAVSDDAVHMNRQGKVQADDDAHGALLSRRTLRPLNGSGSVNSSDAEPMFHGGGGFHFHPYFHPLVHPRPVTDTSYASSARRQALVGLQGGSEKWAIAGVAILLHVGAFLLLKD